MIHLRRLTDAELLKRDTQLVRRVTARQYVVALEAEPGERAQRTFRTRTGYPVGWRRRAILDELFVRGLALTDDTLTVVLSKRGRWMAITETG